MAKKRKTSKKSPARRSTKRRSMGAIGSKTGFKNLLPMIGGLVVGAVGATAIDKATARFNLSPRIVGIGKMALGLYMTGSDQPLFRGLGFGVASSGAIQTASGIGLLGGLANRISGIIDDAVGGLPSDGNYLGGIETDAYLSGTDAGSEYPFNDPYNPGVLGSAVMPGMGS